MNSTRFFSFSIENFVRKSNKIHDICLVAQIGFIDETNRHNKYTGKTKFKQIKVGNRK